MKDKRLLYLFLIVAVAGIAIVVFINTGSLTDSDTTQEKKAVEFSNWNLDYSLNNKNPYGLYVFQELAISNEKFEEFNSYTNYNLLDSIVRLDSSVMMYIGSEFTFTDREIDKLLEGVSQGNDFFLSIEIMPHYLFRHFFNDTTINLFPQMEGFLDIEEGKQKTVNHLFRQLFNDYSLRFIPKTNVSFKIGEEKQEMYYLYEGDTLTYLWKVFQKEQFDSRFKVLSTIDGNPTFFSFQHGKGKIFIHLNPIVFSNYQLLRPEGKSYLKEVFSTQRKKNIQWLTFAEYAPVPYDPSSDKFEPNILGELFKHPAFRWGFIFAVFGLMLYLLFRSKRRRPVIPAVISHKNTGYNYVDTLAGIYFDKNHSKRILQIIRHNFYSAVSNHFYIDLAKNSDSKSLLSLSKKSNVPIEEIESIIKHLEVKTDVNDTFLTNVTQLQRSFYFKSGIWTTIDQKRSQNQPTVIYRKKELAFGLIGTGVFLILLALLFLSISIGFGVLFIPLGVIIIIIGIRTLNIPAMRLKPKAIELEYLFRKKSIILHEKIKVIYQNGQFLTIELKDGNKRTLNLAQLENQFNQKFQHLKNQFKNE